MNRYSSAFNTSETPQTEKIPGSTQVANSAGGFSWQLDDWGRLQRFLILGNEGGSYYTSERKMTTDNAEAVLRCIKEDGPRVVKTIVDISVGGRAPKNDPAIFALALCAAKGNDVTRKTALGAVNDVCRIGTHLFSFMDAIQGFRGWGRGLKSAIGEWYTSKELNALTYQLVKYQQRNGWSHRDALRLAHVKPVSSAHSKVLAWAVGKNMEELYPGVPVPNALEGYLELQAAKTEADVVKVLKSREGLPWEIVPSEHLKSAKVWDALLPSLPLGALVRNLGRLTSVGLIAPLSNALKAVCPRLMDPEEIRKARLHPIAFLGAMGIYKQGHGDKGKLSWTPESRIIDALDFGFYTSFGNVKATGKRWMLSLDVSGSMSMGTIAGMPGITPRVGSSAMAMVTARSEANYSVMAFSSRFMPLDISPRQRLDDICAKTEKLPFESTDCALPMKYALEKKIPVDVFAVYTDSETYAGTPHPSQALEKYREKMGINAKLVVIGMLANPFTIADPNDAGMLDVVGFDTATPNIMSDFATH